MGAGSTARLNPPSGAYARRRAALRRTRGAILL